MKTDTLIIIPVFNEADNIIKVLDGLRKHIHDVDILIVNDGSTDQTGNLLQGKDVFLVNHLFNMGIGASFKTGCQYALDHGYKQIVRMDGDGQHEARFIDDLLRPIKSDKLDICIGSRFLGDSDFKSSRARIFGIKIICIVLLAITRCRVTDPTSGFIAMNKKAFEFFAKNCVDDYPEPEILCHHEKFRISEIPVSINKREAGVSSITPLKSAYYMIKVIFSLIVRLFR
jgi:glycosyltransferase involved in cell wall biosynthesis